jgi:RNA polymerase sigma-32 factor
LRRRFERLFWVPPRMKGKGDDMAGKTNVPAVPALGGEASLNRYLSEIRKFPILTPEQ